MRKNNLYNYNQCCHDEKSPYNFESPYVLAPMCQSPGVLVKSMKTQTAIFKDSLLPWGETPWMIQMPIMQGPQRY